MMETLRKWWNTLLERLPRKNRTPEQKKALIKRTAVLGGALVVLSVLVLTVALFPVTRIQVVENTSYYTNEEITDALQTRAWTPVLGLLFGRGEQRLLDKLLYLESAEVTYGFPGTLRVSVSEQSPLFYFPYETELSGKPHAGWMLVGDDLRIVDAGQDSTVYAERGYVKIALPEPKLSKTEPGRASSLKFTDEESEEEDGKTEADFAYITEFLSYLRDSAYWESVTAVDLENKFDVRIVVNSKWQIRFGRVTNAQDFAQKVEMAEQILSKMGATDGQKFIVDVGASTPYGREDDQTDPDQIWD